MNPCLALAQKALHRDMRNEALQDLIHTMNTFYFNKTNNYMKGKMDLMSAKKEAAKLSQRQLEKKIYIIVDSEGDCGLSYNPNVDNCVTLHAYRNGAEVALDVSETTAPQKSKTNKVMATTPKAAPKKPAPAVNPNLIGKATTMHFTKGQWDKLHKAVKDEGTTIRDAATAAIKAKYKL